jgi:hypothetical protein
LFFYIRIIWGTAEPVSVTPTNALLGLARAIK